MIVKQSHGKVYGATFTAKEKRAMTMEINRQLAEASERHEVELVTLVLYVLHAHLGFGKKRLRRFFEAFDRDHQKLLDYYQMPEEDNVWLADQMLQHIGVDVPAWMQERDRSCTTDKAE